MRITSEWHDTASRLFIYFPCWIKWPLSCLSVLLFHLQSFIYWRDIYNKHRAVDKEDTVKAHHGSPARCFSQTWYTCRIRASKVIHEDLDNTIQHNYATNTSEVYIFCQQVCHYSWDCSFFWVLATSHLLWWHTCVQHCSKGRLQNSLCLPYWVVKVYVWWLSSVSVTDSQ